MVPFFLVHLLPNSFFSDIERIRSGIGDKAALFLQNFSTFSIGFIIAFVRNWKLTLVVATMMPLLSFLGAAVARVRISRVNKYMYHTALYCKVRLII